VISLPVFKRLPTVSSFRKINWILFLKQLLPNAANVHWLHYQLPANEDFKLEYVTDKPWSGYNWYKGNYQSVIQINTDLQIFINRAIDVGSHESYPGHHVYNMLLEKNLYAGKGWIEISLYPLFSPQSLIAEGSANYGIEVAFPVWRKPILLKTFCCRLPDWIPQVLIFFTKYSR
jgi:hypothetical protein